MAAVEAVAAASVDGAARSAPTAAVLVAAVLAATVVLSGPVEAVSAAIVAHSTQTAEASALPAHGEVSVVAALARVPAIPLAADLFRLSAGRPVGVEVE